MTKPALLISVIVGNQRLGLISNGKDGAAASKVSLPPLCGRGLVKLGLFFIAATASGNPAKVGSTAGGRGRDKDSGTVPAVAAVAAVPTVAAVPIVAAVPTVAAVVGGDRQGFFDGGENGEGAAFASPRAGGSLGTSSIIDAVVAVEEACRRIQIWRCTSA